MCENQAGLSSSILRQNVGKCQCFCSGKMVFVLSTKERVAGIAVIIPDLITA